MIEGKVAMLRRSRFVEVTADVDLTVFEMTEEEVETLKDTARRIVRICNLEPQDFDRKGVKTLAQGMMEILGELGHEL